MHVSKLSPQYMQRPIKAHNYTIVALSIIERKEAMFLGAPSMNMQWGQEVAIAYYAHCNTNTSELASGGLIVTIVETAYPNRTRPKRDSKPFQALVVRNPRFPE